jgi:hypothetical protein
VPMLLNEIQKLNAQVEVEVSARRRLSAQSAALDARLSALERRTEARARATRLSEAFDR